MTDTTEREQEHFAWDEVQTTAPEDEVEYRTSRHAPAGVHYVPRTDGTMLCVVGPRRETP